MLGKHKRKNKDMAKVQANQECMKENETIIFQLQDKFKYSLYFVMTF